MCAQRGASASIVVSLPASVEMERTVACSISNAGIPDDVSCEFIPDARAVTLSGPFEAHAVATLELALHVASTLTDPPANVTVCGRVSDGAVTGDVCASTVVDPVMDPPTITSTASTVAPGQTFNYNITFVTAASASGAGGVIDQLPNTLEIVTVICFTLTGQTAGICEWNSDTNTAILDVPQLVPYDTLRMQITVRLKDSLFAYPAFITNCAQVMDGASITAVCINTPVSGS